MCRDANNGFGVMVNKEEELVWGYDNKYLCEIQLYLAWGEMNTT